MASARATVLAAFCVLALALASQADGFVMQRLIRNTRSRDTTNAICRGALHVCAFHTYDIDTLEFIDFIPICHCPGGTVCSKDYNNLATGVYNMICE